MKGTFQHLLAYIIGGALLVAMIYFIDDPKEQKYSPIH